MRSKIVAREIDDPVASVLDVARDTVGDLHGRIPHRLCWPS